MKPRPKCNAYEKEFRKFIKKTVCTHTCVNMQGIKCCMNCPVFRRCTKGSCPIVRDRLKKFVALRNRDVRVLT